MANLDDVEKKKNLYLLTEIEPQYPDIPVP
jgi:hypothetical protein